MYQKKLFKIIVRGGRVVEGARLKACKQETVSGFDLSLRHLIPIQPKKVLNKFYDHINLN